MHKWILIKELSVLFGAHRENRAYFTVPTPKLNVSNLPCFLWPEHKCKWSLYRGIEKPKKISVFISECTVSTGSVPCRLIIALYRNDSSLSPVQQPCQKMTWNSISIKLCTKLSIHAIITECSNQKSLLPLTTENIHRSFQTQAEYWGSRHDRDDSCPDTFTWRSHENTLEILTYHEYFITPMRSGLNIKSSTDYGHQNVCTKKRDVFRGQPPGTTVKKN